ncbi:MAG: 4a-hydroxytetrahydrobiopterin dehydratase [Pseudomonadota bacterium]
MNDRTLMTEGQLEAALERLNAGLEKPWDVRDGTLYKEFRFRDFSEAFGFMSRAALAAEQADHHPYWCNVYRTVTVHLSTHDAGGITALDFALAGRMESLVG